MDEYDYVIAGAGSAGCVLAARLAEDPSLRILLIEAGGSGKSLFATMPAGNGMIHGNPTHDWLFTSVPQSGLDGRQLYFPRGKGVGGSSLMNGMIYMRGNPADYDRWRHQGLDGWGYADVLPYFKRSEGASHRAGDPYHGANGPLKINPASNFGRLDQLFVKACLEAGNPANADFNGRHQVGAGRMDSKVFGGRRQSARESYLRHPPRNLTIRTGEHVLRVAIEGGRAVGLVLSGGTVRAEREVILSLGAFGSPQCLMLSGIGPADHLREHGIDVRLDRPGVGASLYDHPVMPIQFGLREPLLSMARFQRLDRAAIMGLRYLLTRTGPGAGSFWSAVLYHAIRDPEMPDLEIFFTPMVVREDSAAGEKGFNIQSLMSIGRSVIARGKMATPGMQLDINILKPRSHGTVRLASDDPMQMPLIDPAYLQDPRDLDDLVAGVRHLRDVMAQPAMHGICGAELSPGPENRSDADLARCVRALATTGHHPVSTCRMGPDGDAGAVLDETLALRGIAALRVVDASSFPDQINGNTNAPVIMLAEKAADMILGKPPLPREDPRAHPQNPNETDFSPGPATL